MGEVYVVMWVREECDGSDVKVGMLAAWRGAAKSCAETSRVLNFCKDS